jgi:hypothetical protein
LPTEELLAIADVTDEDLNAAVEAWEQTFEGDRFERVLRAEAIEGQGS